MSRPSPYVAVTPQILLRAYSIGLFPMAENAQDDQLYWVDPQERAVFPLDRFKVSRSLAKVIRSDRFEIRIDSDFDAVIDGCAMGAERESTWINAEIRRLYRDLFDMGFVHTVEAWRNGALQGGLYGVCLRAVFFGESMFHKERDASKVALAHLVARLRTGGFRLLDAQFMTAHLASLGAVEIAREAFHRLLDDAIAHEAGFLRWPKEKRVGGQETLAALREVRTEATN